MRRRSWVMIALAGFALAFAIWWTVATANWNHEQALSIRRMPPAQDAEALDPADVEAKAPALARLLEEIVRTGHAEVGTSDPREVKQIEDYLNDQMGSYTETFEWRGEFFQASLHGE